MYENGARPTTPHHTTLSPSLPFKQPVSSPWDLAPTPLTCFRTVSTIVKLKSKQEDIFEVEKEVACRSVTVQNMVEDTGLDTPVPLSTIDSNILVRTS